MLRILKTKPELSELLDIANDNLPQLIDLQSALKLYLNDLTPDSPIEVYAYPWPQPRALAYIVRNKFIRTYVSFKLTKSGTLLDVDQLLDAAPNFFDDFKEFTSYNTDFAIYKHLNERIEAKFDFTPQNLCRYVYMPIGKQQEVANMDVVLPEGYRFIQLDAERDAEFITSTWKHAAATELANTKTKIAHLPSVGVKFHDSLVAFEMLYPVGAMNHLFVVPEHRGKGLGKAVELKLCQKMIEMNIWPYKFVESSNTIATSMTIKSDLWLSTSKSDSDRATLFNFCAATRR
uniref:Glycine N-acyltransferase-like protein n=1 Tax=Plectus sambesii TaxID=2011161 RepID=A0A914VYI5_9BILA